jgi:hypothetical protein
MQWQEGDLLSRGQGRIRALLMLAIPIPTQPQVFVLFLRVGFGCQIMQLSWIGK